LLGGFPIGIDVVFLFPVGYSLAAFWICLDVYIFEVWFHFLSYAADARIYF